MSFNSKEDEESYGNYEIAGPAIASKLPFEILAQIFEEVLAYDTPENPVETLLLICKSWYQAALDHPPLWSTFLIMSYDFKFWRGCIPRRLNLCPSDRLLDISIRISDRIQTDPEGDRQCHQDIFFFLTGKDGEVARRWRRFLLHDFHITPTNSYEDPVYNLARYCVFPTPNLQYLSLRDLESSSPVFPETPSLKVFYAHDLRVPALPNLGAAVDVYILGCHGLDPSLPGTSQLVSLQIGTTSSYPISSNRSYLSRGFPRLKSLKLWGGLSDDEILRFSAPALERLCVVTFYNNLPIKRVLSCKGLSFEQIRELELWLDRVVEPPGYHDALCQLLCAAKNISVLRIYGAYTLGVVTKALTTDCQSLYNDHTLVLKVAGQDDIKLEPGVARGPVLDALTEKILDAGPYLKPPGNV